MSKPRQPQITYPEGSEVLSFNAENSKLVKSLQERTGIKFYPQMDGAGSENFLKSQPDGTFLLRLDSRGKGVTLSYNDNGTIIHRHFNLVRDKQKRITLLSDIDPKTGYDNLLAVISQSRKNQMSNKKMSATVEEEPIDYIPQQVSLKDLDKHNMLKDVDIPKEFKDKADKGGIKKIPTRQFGGYKNSFLGRLLEIPNIKAKFSVIVNDENSRFRIYFGAKKNKHLGKGGFGKAKVVQHMDTSSNIPRGKWLALKLMADTPEAVKKEAAILAAEGKGFGQGSHLSKTKIKHSHTKKNTNERQILMMELAEGTSLRKISAAPTRQVDMRKAVLNSRKYMEFAVNILQEVNTLHKQGFIHRDIKGDNFVVDIATGKASLIDKGLAISLPQGQREIIDKVMGTKGFMAPEIMQKGSYSTKSDSYATGITLFNMFGLYNPGLAAARIPDAKARQEIHDIVKSMTLFDVNERMDVKEALQKIQSVLYKSQDSLPHKRIVVMDVAAFKEKKQSYFTALARGTEVVLVDKTRNPPDPEAKYEYAKIKKELSDRGIFCRSELLHYPNTDALCDKLKNDAKYAGGKFYFYGIDGASNRDRLEGPKVAPPVAIPASPKPIVYSSLPATPPDTVKYLADNNIKGFRPDIKNKGEAETALQKSTYLIRRSQSTPDAIVLSFKFANGVLMDHLFKWDGKNFSTNMPGSDPKFTLQSALENLQSLEIHPAGKQPQNILYERLPPTAPDVTKYLEDKGFKGKTGLRSDIKNFDDVEKALTNAGTYLIHKGKIEPDAIIVRINHYVTHKLKSVKFKWDGKYYKNDAGTTLEAILKQLQNKYEPAVQLSSKDRRIGQLPAATNKGPAVPAATTKAPATTNDSIPEPLTTPSMRRPH